MRLEERAPHWWRTQVTIPVPVFRRDNLEAQAAISDALAFGRGYIAYVLRSPTYLRDAAEFDDRLVIELATFESRDRLLAELVAVFRPYRGAIEGSGPLVLDDWDAAAERGQQTGRDEDGRHGVWRVHPQSYFDNQLCELAFGASAEDVVLRLKSRGIRAELLLGGVLLDEPVHGDDCELLAFDVRFRSALASK